MPGWEPYRYLASLLPSAVPIEEQPFFGTKGQEGSSVTCIPARDGGKGRAYPPSPFSTSSTKWGWTLSHTTLTRHLDPCSSEKQGGWWRQSLKAPYLILSQGEGSNASRVLLCHSSSSHLQPCSLHLKKGTWETNQSSLTVIISTVLLSCSIQIFILPLSEVLSLFLFENSFQAFWTSHRMQSKQTNMKNSLAEGEAQQNSYLPLLDFCPGWLWVDTSNASIDRVCRSPLSSHKSGQARSPLTFSSRAHRVIALDI